jgi:hypothetical protein
MVDQELASTILESSKRLEVSQTGECFKFWVSMSVRKEAASPYLSDLKHNNTSS